MYRHDFKVSVAIEKLLILYVTIANSVGQAKRPPTVYFIRFYRRRNFRSLILLKRDSFISNKTSSGNNSKAAEVKIWALYRKELKSVRKLFKNFRELVYFYLADRIVHICHFHLILLLIPIILYNS